MRKEFMKPEIKISVFREEVKADTTLPEGQTSAVNAAWAAFDKLEQNIPTNRYILK